MVQQVRAEYEMITGANINYDKSKGFWLEAWRGVAPLLDLSQWSDGLTRILGV